MPSRPDSGLSVARLAWGRGRASLSIGAAVAALTLLGGAAEQARPPAKPAAAVLRPAAPVQDQFVSSYICLRVQPGVNAIQLADGSWTLRRAAANGDGGAGGAGDAGAGDAGAGAEVDDAMLAQDERAINAVFKKHNITRIARFMNGEFKRPDLAAKYGLDRSHMAYVGDGADVQALIADIGANYPALVDHAQRDNIGSLAGIPNDANFNLQWNMHNTGQTVSGVPGVADADIDAPEAWNIHTGSSDTIIAILDSGVQSDHPDLNGKVLVGVDTYGDDPPPFPTDTTDLHGHGTHVAGIAAARGNDGLGVAGVDWNAKILPIRITSPTFTISQVDTAEAVIYATDNGADVINMSIQFYLSGVVIALQDAVAYAYDAGTLPVAASGNNQAAGTIAWPAKYPKCMAVGATNNTDARWSQSNNGPELDVVAPGQNVYSSWSITGTPSTLYNYLSGTSMASPHVAGQAALISSRNPALTSAQIETIIKNTCDDKGAVGWDSLFGWGRINLNAALIAAAPPCEGNTNGDGAVNVTDLLAVISAWGSCVSPPTGCTGDVAPAPAGDGLINVTDLLLVISSWGDCP